MSEADIEKRMQQGFNVGILQSFNDSAFRAVAKSRQISGRDKEKCGGDPWRARPAPPVVP